MNNNKQNDYNRRKFIADVGKTGVVTFLLSQPLFAQSVKTGSNTVTVGEIMDSFISESPTGPLNPTVDTLKSGSREMVVTGILTTMFPTIEIINKAITRKMNFIICHEPTYYSHTDDTVWLQNDEVYKYKSDLLKKHNITIWRNHDYIHRHRPDGVLEGVTDKLDWKKFQSMEAANVFSIPKTSLKSLISQVKRKMKIPMLRYIGNVKQSCTRVLLLPGAWGGRRQIEMTGTVKPDVLICGEVSEWETAEYVRDARAKGQKLSLIILGHADSEEPGSSYMKTWLNEKFPQIPVEHIPTGNPLSFG